MPRSRKSVTEIQMPSDVRESCRLRKVVCRLAASALSDPSDVADVELAVGEAFSNAVKYGGRNCKVSVKVEMPSRRKVAVEMAYPGSKFDTTIRYPQDVLNADGGFGRYIIDKIIDSMEYCFEDDQTTLRITKRSH